jgi:hypothetical protein
MSEDLVRAEASRICDRTRRAIPQHGGFGTEEEMDEFIARAHRDALAEIPDAALRLRVALVLSYQGGDGREPGA